MNKRTPCDVKRIQFSHDCLSAKLLIQNLFSSGESRFCVRPNHCWVWSRRGEYEEGIFDETNKHSKISIHLLEAIAVGVKFPLIIFDENANSIVSVESLIQNGLLDLANVMFGERHWHLFQDGAKCYTSTQSLDA
jgi:hypothetical protein